MNNSHISRLREKVSGGGLRWSSFFVLFAVLIMGGFFVFNAMAVGPVTPATGAESVSIDTTSNGGSDTWTALSNPKISEGSQGDIGVGTHTITLPVGWEFNTSKTVSIGLTSGGASGLALGTPIVTPTVTTLSFYVAAASTNSAEILTFDGIQVRPTNQSVGSGTITATAGTILGVDGTTNFGTLTTVAGVSTQIKVETAADGNGAIVPVQSVVAGSSISTAYSIQRDQFNNFVSNSAAAWTTENETGGVIDGDLIAAGDFKSAVFTGGFVGTATIRATDGGLTQTESGTITVTPAAPGTPTVVGDSYINNAEETAGFNVVAPLGLSGAIAGDTLELLLGGISFNTPLTRVLDAGDIAAGLYTFNVISGQLGVDGAKSITAEVTDGVNTGPESDALSLTLDTLKPTISSVTVNDDSLIQSDVGVDAFDVTIVFTDTNGMDAGTAPTVEFAPALGTTLTNCDGAWVGDTYTYTCDIEDGNIEEIDVDIDVSGAKDTAGNTMDADTTSAVDEFDVDTIAPTATAVVNPDATTVNVGDDVTVTLTAGGAQTDLTVGACTVNAIDVSGTFINNANGTYTLTYAVVEGHNDWTSGNLPISCVLNEPSGNSVTVVAFDANTLIGDANTPAIPVITSIATDNYINDSEKAAIVVVGTAEANALVSVTLSDGVNSKTETQQLVGDATGFSITINGTAAAPVALIDGTITPSVTAQDAAGNTSMADTDPTATQDTVAPTVNITYPLTTNRVNGTSVITFTDDDLTSAECSIDDANWIACTTGVTTLSNVTGFDALGQGVFTLYLKDTDVAGNIGTDNEAGVIKDTLNPTGTVTLDTATIYDIDLIQEVTIDYDEAMAGASTPTITFTGATGAVASNGDGVWADADTWTETFTITDANEETSPVTVSSSNATDVAGNTEGDGVTDTFDIDTKNPTATVTTSVDPIYEGSLTQTVTVTYDETMNTATTPTITLTGGNWGAQTNVSWNGADDTFTATFTHNGTEEEIAAEVASVADASGATDVIGNPEVGDDSPGFEVDTLKPTVNSATATPDPAKNGVVTLTVVFSETMDVGTSPTVQVTGLTSSPYAVAESSYVGDTWIGMFTLLDQDEDTTATISVNSGEDVARNVMAVDTNAGTFEVDTISPTVSNVAIDTNPVYDGDLTQQIIVTYSEAMDTLVKPTVQITGITTPKSAAGTGAWNDNTHYQVTITLDDDNEDDSVLDIETSGANDVAGNTQVAYTEVNPFAVDTLNPTLTSVSIASNNADPTLAKAGDTVTLSFTSDETIQANPVVAFTSGGVAVANAVTVTNTGGDNWTAAYVVAGGDTSGAVAFTIDFIDTHGNIGVQVTAVTDATSMTVDVVDPTATAVATIDPIYEGSLTQTITVTYSEAMNVIVDPTITITGLASSPYSAVGGAWSTNINTNDTYTVTQVINDNDEETTATVNVSGAEDLAGNTQVANNTETFEVDTLKPTVTSATATPDPAKDGTVTVTVVFSETMDVGTSPTVQVTGLTSSPYAVAESSYVGDTWIGMFTLLDDNENTTGDITISDGKDIAGNIMNVDNHACVFEVDTVNPTVTNVAINTNPVYDGDLTQVVTVTFDEAMLDDATANPSITFSAGTWTSGGDGAYDGTDKIWTETFTLTDINEEVADVDVTVDSAKDVAGNNQVAKTQNDLFDIDTKKPSVLTVEIDTNPISESDLTQVVTVTFDEAMLDDATANPAITFSAGTWTSGGDGAYDGTDKIWTETFTLTDNNEEVVGVTIDVIGAKDALSNVQEDYNPGAEFDIDTKNASITAITPSPAVITDAQVGAGTFTITVDYDEAMTNDGSADPTITFPVEDPINTITFASDLWTDTDTYVATYNVADINEEVADVDVTVDGAKDTDGNNQVAKTQNDLFDIDTKNPTIAEVTPVPTPANDTTPSYTFSSDEAGTITYGGGCVSATTVAGSGNNPITYNVLADGTYGGCTITVTDATGNASTPLSVTSFTIDTVVPVISNLIPTNTTFDATPTIGADYSDVLAGIDTNAAVITVDGTNVTSLANITTDDIFYTPASSMTNGIHTVVVNVDDLAGNSAIQASWIFEVASTGVAVTTDTETVVADGSAQAKITAQVLDANSNPVIGGDVNFIANIGVLSANLVVSDGDGKAETYIKSSEIGLSTITASFNAESGTTQVTFTLYDGIAPVISNLVVSADPAGVGDVLNITFNVSEKLSGNPTVKVDGNSATYVSDVGGLSYTYIYTVTGNETEGDVAIVVNVADLSGNVGSDSITLTLDFSAPTFTVDNGTDVGPVQADTINIIIVENGAITVSEYGFSADATCDGNDTYGNVFTDGANFNITGDHTDYLCVMATNDTGNTGYQLVGQLNVDNTVPTVTAQYPSDNSKDVLISVNPYIDFSEAMDGATLVSGNVELRKYSDNSAVSSAYSITANGDGTTRLTFAPDSSLGYATQYYFFIGTSVKDQAGNAFAANTWYAGQRDSHEFTTIAKDVPVTTYNIPLIAGWNLISLPLIPTDSAIATVLSGIVGDNVSLVRYYDASSASWLSYVPGSGGSLSTMEDGKGYWINMSAADTLTVNGIEMPGPGENLPTYPVVEGWNLIGFKSVEAQKSSAYLSGLDYIIVYGYDVIKEVYSKIAHPTDTDNDMATGSGYWAYFSAAGTIVP